VPRAIRKVVLTDRLLKAMQSATPGERTPIYDRAVPGLLTRPNARGPAFYVQKWDPSAMTTRWLKLGDYPTLSLKDARERARDVLAAIAESRPVPTATQFGMTFAELVEIYKACLLNKRTRREIEAALDHTVAELGDRPAASIRHEDLATFLESVAGQTERNGSGTKLRAGGPHAAAKLRVYLGVMFKWASYHRKGGIVANPMAAISASELLRGRSFNRVRDHIISDSDLRTIWIAASGFRYPFGPLIRALILTGQRLAELAEAQWSEVDDSTECLVIPGERMKGGKAHALPITPRMRELLTELPRFSQGDFIFSTTLGARPIGGYANFKMRFDRAVAEIGRVEAWKIHDVRRSVRTGLARAGVPVFDAELVIGHQQSGVHRVYDRHRYDAEKLNALLRWEHLLDRIIDPPPNVIPLARAVG
jgi:integrase